MDSTKAETIRAELSRRRGEALPYPAERFSGRGIVICAGGTRILTNAYVLVRVLREVVGCALPIEIWHLGRAEMPDVIAGVFSRLGCRIVDAHRVMAQFPGEVQDGWQLKTYALIHSSFEEVLMIDADQVPTRDPACVFDWPEYSATGAVFWPDIIDLSASNPVWSLVGLEPRRIVSWETGQLCIDKRRHWKAINLVHWMCEQPEVFFQIVYGDKDVFLLAWSLLDEPSSLVPHQPLRDGKYLGQRDFAGDVLFQHRTNCKWSMYEEPYRGDGFVWQAECERFIGDLVKVWNERTFDIPARSAEARRLEHVLVMEGRFNLIVGDDDPVKVELLPGHQIGTGRSYVLSNWHVEDVDGGFDIVFHDFHKPSARLRAGPDGIWRGDALGGSRRPAVLEPLRRPFDAVPSNVRTLADDLIDAALPPGSGELDAYGLLAALTLIAGIEPGVDKTVEHRAKALQAREPRLAGEMSRIAEALRSRLVQRVVQPPVRNAGLFGNGPYYVRPAR